MNRNHGQMSYLRRWLRFNAVGLVGVLVQLAILQWLTHGLFLQYQVATLIAVECTIIHNFVWHVLYTWRDRNLHSPRLIFARFVQFHLTNGAVSLAGSLTFMTLLFGHAHVPILISNLVSIVACSLVNFFLGELLVFRVARERRSSRAHSMQLGLAFRK